MILREDSTLYKKRKSTQMRNVDHKHRSKGIFIGDRGLAFTNMLKAIFQFCGLSKNCIDVIMLPRYRNILHSAFTSDTVDMRNNYQMYEQLGDLSANKFIVMYMYKRFPRLQRSECVKIVARLRINYGTKKCFSEIARKLGFWPFITSSVETRSKKMKSLLEDVFEAFIGAVEFIINEHYNETGMGFDIVYKILKTMFDDMDISLRHEDLYDAKTRLKEMFDFFGPRLGVLKYQDSFEPDNFVHSVVNVNKPDGSRLEIGRAKASIKQDAQQKAAAIAIKTLNNMGWKKSVDRLYTDIQSTNPQETTNETIPSEWKADINTLYLTMHKSRFNMRNRETPLSFYARKNNIHLFKQCLQLGARLDIPDLNGMYPLDHFVINNHKTKNTSELLQYMIEKDKDTHACINKSVLDMYLTHDEIEIMKQLKNTTVTTHIPVSF